MWRERGREMGQDGGETRGRMKGRQGEEWRGGGEGGRGTERGGEGLKKTMYSITKQDYLE